jgi:hypothetical protein
MPSQPRDDRHFKTRAATPPTEPAPSANGAVAANDPANQPLRIAEALAAPFATTDVRFRPGHVADKQALAVPYVDVWAVMDRLDQVLGVDGWQDEYSVLPGGSVMCRLRVRVGETWVVKTDVGSRSEQPDAGDRDKAAFSDALKRASVKFGVGRYLYRVPGQWVEWDVQRKRFAKRPALPTSAVPGAQPAEGSRRSPRTWPS